MGKFEKGQYVRCVGANDTELLTVGKVYKVDEVNGGYIDVELDNGSVGGMWSHRFEAWQPKVGDRVRIVKALLPHKSGYIGREFTATKEAYRVDNGVQTWGGDNAGGFVWRTDELEPLPVTFAAPVAAEAQPEVLTIEAGKTYRARDGRKVGPIEKWMGEARCFRSTGSGAGGLWKPDGSAYYKGAKDSPDLIAEWVDEPAAQPAKASNDNGATLGDILQAAIGKTVTVKIAQPKFKVGDTVKRANGFQPHQRLRITKANGDNYSVEWLVGGPGSIDNWRGYEFELVSPAPTNPAIVCLIENGQPKPSTYPHVHSDEGAASKEASRLASVHKGQKFGVYVLTQTVSEEKVYAHEWQRLAIKGDKIPAIKALKAANDLTLKGAKDAVEHWLELNAA